ncbi:F-box domain-containing protein [Mycena indigotica]|uniref:F-box domain-containing protein n=1 Tax=Mycena indigotica TaxID=2126181 RepID=A0A8H6SMN1_9AGAR|nr:F-box domain-containing protein [Mycena indigotica]KAF7302134.1 F-box domain-containing protein [Mycena indigotica]
MARIVCREVEEPHALQARNLVDLNDDIFLSISELLHHKDSLLVSALCRRLRTALLPRIFRAVRWAPAVREFPPKKLWPFVRIFTFSGYSIRQFTPAMHQDFAAQIRTGFVDMKLLNTVILESNVRGGLWPELLDAFSVLSSPCHLALRSHWNTTLSDEEYLLLEPRRTPIPLGIFTFAFPFVYEPDGQQVARRPAWSLALELYNVHTILAAAANTLSFINLPGELLPAMHGATYSALTELVLHGLWPVFLPSTAIPAAEDGYLQITSTRLAEPVEEDALVSEAKSEAAVLAEPSSGSSGEVAPPVSPLLPPTTVDESTITSEVGASIPTSKEMSFTEVHDSSVATAVDTVASTSRKDSLIPLDTAPESTVNTSSPTSLSRPQPSIALLALGSPPSPSESDSFTRPTPYSSANSSSVMSILEAMPNLRILDMCLLHQKDDPKPIGGVICAPDAPPRAPATFLRHLTRFDVASLSQEDRVLEFLPSLEYLSLTRYPSELPRRTVRSRQTPSTLSAMLGQAAFPHLTTLKIWYAIVSFNDLRDEEALLDLLPKKNPSLQNLEVCRRWKNLVPELEGRWDPVPVAKGLISHLHDLQVFSFDPDPPERFGKRPFTHATPEYRQYLGRLRDMAEEIVGAALWLQEIALHCEYGINLDLYWQVWKVVPGVDGNIKLEDLPEQIYKYYD